MKSNYIYFLTLGHLANDMSQGALPALLPFFIMHYHLDYQAAAGLMFASTMLSSVLQPLFGYMSDKFSKPWLISVGITLSGCGLASMGFLENYTALFIAATVSGIGSAIFHPEAARLSNAIAGSKKGRSMSIFSVGGNGGFAVGPILASFCAYYLGMSGLIVFAIFALIVSVLFLFLMPRMQQLATQIRIEESKLPHAAPENDWRAFSRLSVIILCRSIVFALLNTFIPLYWVHVLHQPATTGSMALTILFSFGVLLTLTGGFMADRFGLIKTLRLSYLCMVPVMFLFVHTQNVLIATLLLIPMGFAVFAQFSPMVVLGQTYLAKSMGFASGVTLGLGISLGGIFSPAVGWVADHYGLPFALQILWIVGIVGLIFSFLLIEPRWGKK